MKKLFCIIAFCASCLSMAYSQEGIVKVGITNDVSTQFDMELANAIGKSLGVTIEFIQMKDVIKDDTFLDMDYKYCDCIITADMTAGRLQKYIFTKPYLFYSDGSSAGIAFSKYNENLCKRIDAALDGLKANTIFYTLYQKYYGSATGVSTAPIIQQQSLAPAIPIIYGICLKSTATFTDKTQAAQLQNSLFSIGITSQIIDTFYDYSL